VVIAQINQTQLSPTAFLQTVLVQFGFSPFNMKKAEVLATLNQFLIEQYSSGRKVLLIIDEAQNLSNRVLEEVRLLSGLETTKDKVLRIILAGHPELNDKLNSQELIQLRQRVRLRFHLTALTKNETVAYIDHRLEVAGSQGRRIFAEDTYATIYKYTGGTPRLINTLCDTCMMAAFAQNIDYVSAESLQVAIRELQWTEHTGTSAGGGAAAVALPTPTLTVNAGITSSPTPGRGAIPAPPPEAEPAAPSLAYAAPHPANFVGRILLACEGKTVMERGLRPGRLVIGRTPDNDIQIDSKFISRHHCQIVTQADACVIEDLNSTNGIYVKSKRVRRHNLNDGDVVQLGQHEVMYIDERASRGRVSVDQVDHTDTEVIDKA
jgi:hypothetical protein